MPTAHGTTTFESAKAPANKSQKKKPVIAAPRGSGTGGRQNLP
jgi:hypothetical protein